MKAYKIIEKNELPQLVVLDAATIDNYNGYFESSEEAIEDYISKKEYQIKFFRLQIEATEARIFIASTLKEPV